MTAGAIDHLDLELLVEPHEVIGAKRPQEPERLVVAAKQRVLAVVDELSGFGIAEGRRAAAEARPRLEHEHAGAMRGQANGGAQARKARTYDDDVRIRHAGLQGTAPRWRRQSRRVGVAAHG